MIDGLRRDSYNSFDEAAGLAPSAGSPPQGPNGVYRPLLQQPLDSSAGTSSVPASSLSTTLARRLLGLLPYDFARTAIHAYLRLQGAAWPEILDGQVTVAAEAYLHATGDSRGSGSFQKWERDFRSYALCSLPAQMTAVVATRSPSQVQRRIHFSDARLDRALSDPQAIIAVSRTGLAFAVPWLLSVGGHSVALVAEPSARAHSLLGAFGNWSSAGEIKLIGADALALVRARRAVHRGSIVVIFPESFGPSGRRVTTPFMRTSVQAPLGAATLACRLKLPIQPVCVTSRGNGALVQLADRLDPGYFGSPEDLTRALFEQLGRWALQHPAEWVGWSALASHLKKDA